MKINHGEPPESLQQQKDGSTTLKQCGWCEYASGSHRYNYCIEGKCTLQKSYSNDIFWDTPCIFLTASIDEISNFIDSHKYEIKSAQNTIKRHKKYIVKLSDLGMSAPYRPPLPQDREHDHFNIDDPVVVWDKEDQKWYFGVVKMGYRHQGGCVSFRLDGKGPQEGNDSSFPYEKGYWGCGCAVPTVILKKDWDWFKENPKEYKIWCDKTYNRTFNGLTLVPAPII